jgi:hypothetical protein
VNKIKIPYATMAYGIFLYKNFGFYFALHPPFTIFAEKMGSGGVTAALRKAAKRNAKGHESHAKRAPFTRQKTVFCKAAGK